LLPFDGGHIAIALFEKIRNIDFRKTRGMVAAAPVNYLKLMPATYVILVVVIGYMALTVTADFVNPIRTVPIGDTDDHRPTIGLGMPHRPRRRWLRGARPVS